MLFGYMDLQVNEVSNISLDDITLALPQGPYTMEIMVYFLLWVMQGL